MAITRYAGDRFVIGGSDTQPTGVLDGAYLINTGNLAQQVLRNGTWTTLAGGGGGGSPGGDNTQVQFNDAGSFGGSTGLTFDGQRLYANNFQLSGILYDSNASVGEGGMVLANEGQTGVHWKSIESVLSGVGGSGVANYVARWSDEDTLTSGVIQDNGTSVGIRQASDASNALSIKSVANNENVLQISADDGNGLFNIRQSANDCLVRGYKDGNVQTIQLHSDGASYFNGGSVGIGNNAPGCELHVSGEDPRIRVDGITDSHPGFELSENGTRKWITYNNYVNDNLTFKTNADIRMVIQQDGNVGIGTGAPDQLLHVYRATDDATLHLEAISAGDPTITFTSPNNRNGVLRFLDGSTVARFNYDHANVAFEFKAHNESTIDASISETVQYFAGDVGIGTDEPGGRLDVGTGYMVNEQGRQDHTANTLPQPYYRFSGGTYVGATNDIITVADSPDLDGFTAFSISARIYPVDAYGGIAKKFATAGQKSWMFYYSSSGKLSLAVSSDGTTAEYQESVGGITFGVWNDIAVTFDAGTFKAYINGVDVGVDANFSTQLSAFAGSDPMIIGYANWTEYYLGGEIAGLKVWNKALTDTEIKELYSGASVPFKYKGANQTHLVTAGSCTEQGSGTINSSSATAFNFSSGAVYDRIGFTLSSTLTAGKKYRISWTALTSSSGYIQVRSATTSAFLDAGGTNFGSISGGAGSFEWVALGDEAYITFKNLATPTTVVLTGFEVVQIGAVADYDGSGMTGATWYDKSGNNLDGTLSGPILENRATALIVDDRVGIGTTTPDYTLHVNTSSGNTVGKFESKGADSQAILRVENDVRKWDLKTDGTDGDKFKLRDSTAAADRLIIDASGDVGIGTASAAYRLDVYDTVANIAIFRSTITTYARVVIRAGATGDAQLTFQNNTASKWTIGNDGGDSDKFKIEAGGGAFGTSPLVCILSGGDVGIGTNAPATNQKLDVMFADNINGAGVTFRNDDGSLQFQNVAGSGEQFNPQIKGNSKHTNNVGLRLLGNAASGEDSGTTPLILLRGTVNNAKATTRPVLDIEDGDGTKLVSVAADGNVGINTILPEHKLHVSGDAIISGYLYDSTNSTGVDGYVLTSREDGPQWDYIEDILSGVGGNGTANYVPKWIDSDTIGDSVMAQSGSAIGIGTAAPSQHLDILATQESDAGIRVTLNCDLDSQAPQLVLNRAAQNGGIVDDGDVLGAIKFGGYDGNSVENNTKIEATVNGTPSNNNMPTDLSFYTASAGSPVHAMTINKDQQVGIGTAAPHQYAKLHTLTNGTDNQLRIETHRNDVGQTSVRGYFSRGSAASPAIVQNNDTIFETQGWGYDGANHWRVAEIDFQVDGTPGTNDMPGRLVFSTTADGATAPTEQMRIQSDGKVGIGTNNPAYRLDVDDDSSNIAIFRSSVTNYARVIIRAGAAGDAQLSFQNNTSTKWTIGNDGGDSDKFKIEAGSGAFGTSPLVCILSGGNFGIGTNAPAQTLHVAGGNLSTIRNNMFGILSNSPGAGGETNAFHNAYYDTVNSREEYLVADEACKIQFINGQINFRTAAAGSADGAITWINAMGILADGKVGIGRTIPSTKLVIQGVYDASANPSAIYGNAANKGIEIICEKNGSWPTGYTYGIDFGAKDAIDGTNHYQIAAIYAAVEDVPYQVTGQLKFYTTTGGSSATLEERMTILGSGNVGIGTNVPEGLLSFKADESNTPKIRFQNQHSVTTDAAISTYDDASGTTVLIGSNLYIASTGTTTRYNTGEESAGFRADRGGLLQFYTGETGATATERMRIAADGNVGIGTNNPGYLLHLETAGPNLLKLKSTSSGVTNAPKIHFEQASGGTQTADIVFDQSGQNTLKFTTYYQSATDINRIQFAPADSVAMTICGGTNGAGKDGFVGIGTDAPATNLHITSTSVPTLRIHHDSTSSAAALIQLMRGTTDTFGGDAYTDWQIQNVGGALKLQYNDTAAGSLQTPFSISYLGAVTIGAYTLPTADGTAGYHLQTNGSGTVTWQPGGAGTVTGTGTDNYIPRWNGTTAIQDSVLFYANDDGNVGIGTTAPGTLLHLRQYDTTGPTITMSNNPKTGYINWWGAAGGGTDRTDQFEINAVADGYGATIGAKTYIRFKTDGLGATDERMRIASDGNVGIGTNNPGKKLEVYNSEHRPVLIKSAGDYNNFIVMDSNRSAADSYTGGIVGSWNGTETASIYLRTGSDTTNKDDGYITFQTAPSGSVVERMRIASDGKVGIGTDDPSFTLHANHTNGGAIGLTRTAGSTTGVLGNIWFGNTDVDATIANIRGVQDGATDSAKLVFQTEVAGGSLTERMVISSTGAIQFNAYGSGTHTGTSAYKLSVDSSGNVIETAIGAGAVDGSGTANYITKWTDSDTIGDSNIYDDGDVGIGTASPNSNVHIYTTENTVYDPSQASHQRDEGATINLQNASTTVGSFSQLLFRNRASSVGGCRIVSVLNGADSADLAIVTGDVGEAVRIDSSGLVGIGTNNPVFTLQANGTNGGIIGATRTAGSTTGVLGRLRFGNTDIDSSLAEINAVQDGATDSAKLVFQTEVASGSLTERMVIKSDGKVGIGTNAPDGSGVTLAPDGTKSSTALSNNYGLGITHQGSDATYSSLQINTGSGNIFWVGNSGNVGIGTNDPGEVLQVKGNMTLRGATNLRYKIANDSNNNWAEIGNDGSSGQNTLEFFTGSSTVAAMSVDNSSHATFGGNITLDSATPTIAATGNLYLGTDGNDDVLLLTDSSATFSTALTATSATFTGVVTADAGIVLNDNDKIKLGTSGDMEIYHDGSNSYIEDAGTGALKLKGGDVRIENASGNNLFKGVGNVAAMYHNGSARIATTSAGADFTGLLDITQDSNATSLKIDSAATTDQVIEVDAPLTTTASVLDINDCNSLTTGKIAYFRSNSASTSARQLVEIVNNHASSSETVPLKVIQVAVPWTTQILNTNASGYGLSVDCSANSGTASYALAVYTGTNTGMFVTNQGLVGIGTATPSSLLDLYEPASGDNKLRFHNSTTGTGTSNGARIGLNGAELFINNHESSSIKIYTQGTQTNGICIANDGKSRHRVYYPP